MTSKEWKTVKLGDVIISANTGLDAIKRAPVVDYNTGIKCLRIQDISQNKQFDSWGFCEVEENNFNRFSLKEGDILIARTGATIGVNIQIKDNLIAVYNNGLIRIKINNEITNNKFIFYNLQTRYYKNFINAISAGTSTQPNMQINSLLSFEIPFPPLETQEKIAKVLSSLDDKIELNNKINQNLEQQAQAIFKSWFVDFEPFGGKMPDDWRIGKVEEIINIYDSKRIPLSNKERSEMTKKVYPYYGATSLMDYVDNYIFDGIYLLLGEDGTVIDNLGFPILQYVWGKFWVNNHAHILTGKNGYSVESLYLFFKQKNIKSIVTGAVQAKISQNNLKNLDTLIPSKSTMNEFNKMITPLFDAIRNNTNENKQLTQLRDTLLPKLMSGEIDVDKI